MSDFGELVLVLGDLHIPTRSPSLPVEFADLLVPGKMQHVLCTGNLTSRSVEDYLHTLANHVHIARGDFDILSHPSPSHLPLPDHKLIQIGNFNILLIHGHSILPHNDSEALAMLHRQFDCDIIVTGGNHVNEVYELHGKYVVNPGSATGAYTTMTPTTSDGKKVDNIIPSFILMAIKGSSVVSYVYELKNGEVAVSKSEFVKAM